MKILVSNDDGYRAEGLAALRSALTGLGDLTTVAPDRNRSGASNSLTLDVPLRVNQIDPSLYCVMGTPTDCVHLSLSGLFDHDFDMVVSGINDGENLGDDVLYSGTVAAALEGRFLGLPTVAVSLAMSPTDAADQRDATRHFATAGRVARTVVQGLLTRPLDRSLVLNINVPNLPYEKLRGLRVARLGHRHRSAPALPALDPKGRKVYWVGPSGAGADAGESTDFHAVEQGYAAITPLTADLTRHAALPELRDWVTAL